MFRYAIELNLEPKVFFRDGVGISGVGRLVNDWQASATIELHVNSATPQAFGSETLFDMDPSDSKELAWLCQKSMVSVFKRKGKGDRGAKLLKPEDRGHYQLSLYKMPACITEPAFGSNSGDCQLLWSNASGYARGLVVAVKDFLGGKHA
jgi:N-acetylmuramoyl-L-alanine amidase